MDPLASANKLIFAAGPLTGTAAPSGCRWMAITKGALSGAVACSNAGGDFGPELKYAGHDMIIVEGVAKQPAMLVIDDDSVELCSAQKLWGQNVHATEDLLHEQLGGGFKCVSIGPAGENLVRFAPPVWRRWRPFGPATAGLV